MRPALTPETAAALLRPFFLMMKLAPMKALEDNAKTKPLILSAEEVMFCCLISIVFFLLIAFFFASWRNSNHWL